MAVSYRRQRDGRFAVTVTGAGPGDGTSPDPGSQPGPVADVQSVPGEAERDEGRTAAGVGKPGGEVPHGQPGPVADVPPGDPAPDGDTASLVGVVHTGDGWIEFEDGGQRHRLHVFRHGGRVWVQGPDGDVELAAVPRFPEAGIEEGVTGGLAAPMPGTVLAVHVAAGDTVSGGQLLMIVEAMKMEHRITAPQAGTVREIRARPGEQVAAGDLLAVLDETESTS